MADRPARLRRWLERPVQRISSTPAFARIAPRFIHRVDRGIFGLTRGRFILSDVILPIVMLTTTGRRSGQPRSVPIAALPDGDDWYVIGSNFGGDHHPAWALNLQANGEAVVQQRGRRYRVQAELLDDDERSVVWPSLVERWPPFDRYVDRAGAAGREILVFRLRRL